MNYRYWRKKIDMFYRDLAHTVFDYNSNSILFRQLSSHHFECSTNNHGANRTFLVNDEHMKIVSNPQTIAYVKRMLDSFIAGIPISSRTVSTRAMIKEERKLSVIITLHDELDIYDENGNLFKGFQS